MCGPEEKLFALGALNFSTAGTQAATTKAFRDLAVVARPTATASQPSDDDVIAMEDLIEDDTDEDPTGT